MAANRSFVLRIGKRTRGGFPVTAEFDGHVEQGLIPPALPLLDRDELRQANTWLSRGLIDTPYAQELGDRLFRTLFAGPVDAFFRQACERAGDGGVRVVLSWPLPEPLDSLPWELLYDRVGRQGYLISSDCCSLVRLHGLTLPNLPPTHGPLRVLVISASPADCPPLGKEGERPLSALAGRGPLAARFASLDQDRSGVRITVLPHATRAEVVEQVTQAAGKGIPFHVVHFVGHAEPDGADLQSSADGGGDASLRLMLERPEGADPVPVEEFARLVATPSLNLVLLTPCVRTSETRTVAAAARPFLASGATSVVTMIVPELSSAVVEFARGCYRQFSQGALIEHAVRAARTSQNAAGWSVPVIAVGAAAGTPLKLARPPTKRVNPLHRGWKVFALGLTVLGIVGSLVGIPDLALKVRTRVPIVRCLWPPPMESGAGRFNVVMIPFTHLDARGRVIRDRAGSDLARQLYGLLQSSLAGLDMQEEVNLRGPAQLCAIPGSTPEQRDAAAGQFADRIGANVVVYGVITESPDGPLFAPEFRVNYKGFEDASELVGPYQLGAPVRVSLPVTDDQFQGDSHPLGPRTRALSLVALGLAYQVSERNDEAEQRFQAALDTPGWLDEDGKAVAWLMLGSSHLARAIKESEAAHLPDAQTAFETALELDPGYARAKLGLASVLYMRALGDLNDVRMENVQLPLLDQAEAAYRAAGEMDAPADANIRPKVEYALGQIALLRSYVSGGDRLHEAEQHFNAVVAEYRAGNQHIGRLAADAHAGLATVAEKRGNVTRAVELYRQAAEDADVVPSAQAEYYLSAGDLLLDAGQAAQARELYNKALAVGREHSDQAIVDESRQRLDSVPVE
jgi:tetratricopeptide (TPR) repeat protein